MREFQSLMDRKSSISITTRWKTQAFASIREAVEQGMTKCSNWLTGHDQAAALNHRVPDPDELLRNIEEAEV